MAERLENARWPRGGKCALDSGIMIELTAYFPNEKIQIVRMDSFSSHRGKEMTTFAENTWV